MPERVAVFPPAGSGLGFSSWLREIGAAAFVTLRPAPSPNRDLPRGNGEHVLLIPGFTSGDWRKQRRRGWAAYDDRIQSGGIDRRGARLGRNHHLLRRIAICASRMRAPLRASSRSVTACKRSAMSVTSGWREARTEAPAKAVMLRT